jgi:hypothetical protein
MENYVKKYDESTASINQIIAQLNMKSQEIKSKITELSNKVHLELEKSTHLLQFQHHIIANEITYIETLKASITYNLTVYLYALSESISMMCITYMNIYKDIHPLEDFDRYKVKSSSKKDTITKLMVDIAFNLDALDKLLETLEHFRGSSKQEMQTKLLHSGTLDNDLAAIQGHIQNEVQKYKNILHTKLTYFTDLLEVLNQQLIHSKIYKFINTAS